MPENKLKETEIGMIPEDWDLKPVSSFCKKVTSGGTPSRKNEDYWNNGTILWLKTKELFDSNIYRTEEKITSDGLKNSSAKLFPVDTIVMAMYGATVGKLGIIKNEMTTNQACCALIADKNVTNHLFIFYALLNFRDKLINLACGAAQQNLNQDTIKNLKIPLPPLNEQKKITSILSSIDQKIELNQKINQTLEEIGQAIFNHWFVNFEFPNEERKPYKSSGGEMVDSELGEIPEGWEVFTLGDLCSSISETYNLKNKDGIFFLNTGDLFDGKVINHQFADVESLPGQAKKKIHKNDILYSEIRPANRRFAFVDFDAEDYVVSTKLMVLRANDNITPELLFQFLKMPSIIEYFQGLAESRSGTFPQITFDTIKHIQIALPNNKEDIICLGSIFSYILKIVNQNVSQNKSLTKIRDSLLPKLISGKIRVK